MNGYDAPPKAPSRAGRIVTVALGAVLLLTGGMLLALLLSGGSETESAPVPEMPAATVPQSTPTFEAPAAETSSRPGSVEEEESESEEILPESSAPPKATQAPKEQGPEVGQIVSFSIAGDPESMCATAGGGSTAVSVEFRYRTKNAVEAGFGIDTHDGIHGTYSGPLSLPDGSFTFSQPCNDPQTYALTVKGADGVHHSKVLRLFQ